MRSDLENIAVVECGEESADTWNTFVRQMAGTYCHLFGWKHVFERAYRLRCLYLAFRKGDRWTGVLPLCIMPHLPGAGRKAVSLPFCNYGGVIAAPEVPVDLLERASLVYLSKQDINKVEFRGRVAGSPESDEVTMILSLPDSVEELWKRIGDKARNQIRKAQRSDLTVCWGAHQTKELYTVYSRSMGRLGTPVHSPRFVTEIVKGLRESVDILTVRYKDNTIGAMLLLKFGDTWSDPIASCLMDYKALNPNMLLYWEALRAACQAGVKSFDFGRSQRGSGTFRFKKQWDAQEIPLNYHSYRKGEKLPVAATTFYRSRVASTLAKVWQRLPHFMQDQLGPAIRQWLP